MYQILAIFGQNNNVRKIRILSCSFCGALSQTSRKREIKPYKFDDALISYWILAVCCLQYATK